jgi:hypothetical protein
MEDYILEGYLITLPFSLKSGSRSILCEKIMGINNAGSVSDDPDPLVFGPPGSRSGSVVICTDPGKN